MDDVELSTARVAGGKAGQKLKRQGKSHANLLIATWEQGKKVGSPLSVFPEAWKHPIQGLILSISFAGQIGTITPLPRGLAASIRPGETKYLQSRVLPVSQILC